MARKAAAMDEPPGGTWVRGPRWVEDGSGAVTIAERAARWQPIVPRLMTAGFLVGVVAQDSRTWLTLGHILVTVALLAIVAALLWEVAQTWRMALRFGGDGITVRNLRRTYRINWPEVRCFADGSVGRGQSGRFWALAIVLHDGRVVTAAGTAGARRAARPDTLAAIRQAAERYGIPAQLTGTPAKQGSPGAPAATAAAVPAGSWEGTASSWEGTASGDGTASSLVAPRTRPGHSGRTALAVAGVGVLVLAALGTFIGLRSSSTSSNQLAFDQLQPGDCLAGSNMGLATGGSWPESVTRVACTQRHEAEVYFVGNLWPQSLAYPGQEAIDGQSQARCEAAFASYDGVSLWVSEFTFTDIVDDDSASWASGERSVVCVAYELSASGPSGGMPVDYSLKGSRR